MPLAVAARARLFLNSSRRPASSRAATSAGCHASGRTLTWAALLEAADAPNVSALYLFRDGDGNDAVASAELTLLGIVSTTGAGLASTDITLA